MFTSIKTSKANKEIVADLTRKLGLGAENIIARIAISYSLSKDRKLNIKQIEDAGGKEYSNKVLFGVYQEHYVAMICQQYGIYKTNADVPKYIKLHLDDGLQLVQKTIEKSSYGTGFDFLLEKINE